MPLPSARPEEPGATPEQGMRLVLVNDTDRSFTFDTAYGGLYLVQEALDEAGAWRAIERAPRVTCGNALGEVVLGAGEFWDLPVPRYRGPFQTRLRFRLTFGPRPGGGQTGVLSNELVGSIHPEQFRNRRW